FGPPPISRCARTSRAVTPDTPGRTTPWRRRPPATPNGGGSRSAQKRGPWGAAVPVTACPVQAGPQEKGTDQAQLRRQAGKRDKALNSVPFNPWDPATATESAPPPAGTAAAKSTAALAPGRRGFAPP